ncbi:hypothetical protein PHYBOEH_006283 [Phytophthora boehmeriae]|uniref:Glycoside-Pentoside-Hexuronide (GPH):Cation Symporter Family n=1 Tax=Phytophthora boehmeriae TaxID=109152 RepID=A0A8T1WHL1_9STRA|nr:hypothetical protein PHYBOEH_006283 [Phytophthora boehmeriae]
MAGDSPRRLLHKDGCDEDSGAYAECATPDNIDLQPTAKIEASPETNELKVRQLDDTSVAIEVGNGPDRTDTSDGIRGAFPEIEWTVKTRTLRTCLVLAMPWAAYSILNTVFTNVRLSYMESMGISDFVPRFVPSLIQIFLGPILGAMSDRSLSKWGRRNVFLMAAAGIVTVSGLLFGSANVLFPHLHSLTKLLLVLLSIGVLLLNIGLRARIMDVVPIEFQVHAQATLAMYEGVGGVLGSLLFRSTTDAVVFASAISGEDILSAFSATMAAIFVSTAVSIYLRPENPQDKPAFQPRLGLVGREAWRQIVHAPKVFRFLCLIYFVLSFAWLSFSDEVYQWWGGNVYGGCKTKGCDVDDQSDYKKGLDMANFALISQNGLEAMICLVVLLIMPRVPDAYYLKRVAVLGLSIGAIALVIAVSVGRSCKQVAFTGFVATAFYHTVANVFPFSIVGIMGKELQISARRFNTDDTDTSDCSFNNNGLYIGVLMLFSAVSELTVQLV